MVTAAELALAVKIVKTGFTIYKKYKRSNKGKAQRKRRKMNNKYGGSK